MLNIEHLQASFDARMMIREANKHGVNNVGLSVIKRVVFQSTTDGVRIIYPDGTKRFVKNTWYDEQYETNRIAQN